MHYLFGIVICFMAATAAEAQQATVRIVVVPPAGGSIVQRPMGSDAGVALPYCDSRYAAVGQKCVVRPR